MLTRIRAHLARWRATLTPVLNLLLFALAIWVVNRVLAEYRYAEIAGAVAAVPLGTIALTLVVSAAAYLALVGYDYLAFRFAGHPLPWRTMLIPSFVAWAVSNTAPASVLTAGGLRYRLYAGLGLTAADAAVVAAFNVVTYLVGLLALVGLVLLFHPSTGMLAGSWLALPGRTLGAVLLLAVGGYLLATRFRRTPVRVLRWRFRLPSLGLALAQLGVSALDWLLSSGALYVLLAGVGPLSYLDFLGAFLLAQMATQLLPLPGGIGVFEAVVLVLRPHGAAAPAVLAGLLLYRVAYYLLPLVAAGILIAVREVVGARRRGKPLEALREGVTSLAPTRSPSPPFSPGPCCCSPAPCRPTSAASPGWPTSFPSRPSRCPTFWPASSARCSSFWHGGSSGAPGRPIGWRRCSSASGSYWRCSARSICRSPCCSRWRC